MSVGALASLFFFSFVADERMFTDLLITSLIGGFISTNLNLLSTLLVLETDGDRSSKECDIENSAGLLDSLPASLVMAMTIFTIGHSSHELTTFFALLADCNITQIVDIRRSPRSTRYPHYNLDSLRDACSTNSSLQYSFEGDVFGARRRRRRRSLGDLNSGLTDPDDQAYADHMQRPEFGQAVSRLLRPSLVLMCSENDPQQCHRSLLADYLSVVHQVNVIHILFDGGTRPHQLHVLARLNGDRNTCVYSSISSS